MKESIFFSQVIAGFERTLRANGGPATFNLWDELEMLGRSAASAGTSHKTLVRYADFRIDLVAVRRGITIAQHSNPGRVAVHCLNGLLRMQTAGGSFELPTGEVLVLDRGVWHDVEALADSAFLLTISLPNADVPAMFDGGRWVFPPAYATVEPAVQSASATVVDAPAEFTR